MEYKKRLIDANALMESKWWDSLKDDFDKARAKIIVQSCPTVDAVEVVRYKDCKWWDGNYYCTNVNGAKGMVWNGEWFCGSGERREGE